MAGMTVRLGLQGGAVVQDLQELVAFGVRSSTETRKPNYTLLALCVTIVLSVCGFAASILFMCSRCIILAVLGQGSSGGCVGSLTPGAACAVCAVVDTRDEGTHSAAAAVSVLCKMRNPHVCCFAHMRSVAAGPC
jgi:hypothetical protein